MRKMLVGLVGCLALAMVIGAAEATVLVDDDFESDTIGSLPTNWDQWDFFGDLYVSNLVVIPGSTKSVYFNDTGAGGGEKLSMQRKFTEVTQELCVVDLHFRGEQLVQVNQVVKDGGSYLSYARADAGNFVYHDGGGWNDTGVDWTTDTWYHLKYVLDVDDKTWDWYIDDTLIASNIAWFSAGTAPDRFNIDGDYDLVGTWYIDDVTVEAIPEPGTAFLLLGGVMGLLFLRRKRS